MMKQNAGLIRPILLLGISLAFVALATACRPPVQLGSVSQENPPPTSAATLEAAPQSTELPQPRVGISGSSQSNLIRLAGSTSMHPLIENLAETYLDKNPSLMIEINGGGSTRGMYAVVEGTADIGNISREPLSQEIESKQFNNLRLYGIGYDVIAVVTSSEVELPPLSIEQIREIFSGEITNFEQVGGPNLDILIVTQGPGSKLRSSFESLVMTYEEDGQVKSKAIHSGDTVIAASSDDEAWGIVGHAEDTRENTTYIGYLPLRLVDEYVNAVAVEGISPSVSTVVEGSYPLFHPLYMGTNGQPQGITGAFIDFVYSDQGQEIISQQHLPISASWEEPEDENKNVSVLTTEMSMYATDTVAAAGPLQLAGSYAIQNLMEKLAAEYQLDSAGQAVVNVHAGGTEFGLRSIAEGTAQLAPVFGELTSEDFAGYPDLQVFTVGRTGIAIVAGSGFDLAGVSLEELGGIFTGDITNLEQLEGPDQKIQVISPEDGAEIRLVFEQLVMSRQQTPTGKTPGITEKAAVYKSIWEIYDAVLANPNAIAYLPVTALDGRVLPLEIDGTGPTASAIQSGEYPLGIPFNLVTNGVPSPEAQAFIDFVLGPIGQSIVSEELPSSQ